jgi:CRISPR-associated protein Cmr3
MSRRRFLLRPTDTLFFRDGQPFNQEDEGMAAVHSLFPPSPSVLVGAFRAAVARSHGWQEGRERSWTEAKNGTELKDLLGDGQNLGQLAFGPPVLLREAEDGWQRLYPAPQHLVEGRDEEGCKQLAFLRPDEQRSLMSDQGAAVAYPAPTNKKLSGLKPLAGRWLTPAGMTAVLAGRRPGADDILEEEALLGREFRVGLGRDPASRTAREGQLYAATHIRPIDGGRGRKAVALGLEVEGLPDDKLPKGLHPVGRFQRTVSIEPGGWQGAAAPSPSTEYLVVLTAPLRLPACDGWRKPGVAPFGLPGELVGACLDRPVMIGGWDGVGSRPLAMRAHLPAGSVLFLSAGRGEIAAAPPPSVLGEDTKWGFGQCLIGAWPTKES